MLSTDQIAPVDTGRKLNVLYTFNLRPVSTRADFFNRPYREINWYYEAFIMEGCIQVFLDMPNFDTKFPELYLECKKYFRFYHYLLH